MKKTEVKMAGINLLADESSPKGRNLLAEPPAPKTGFAAGAEQVGRGALEAIPFVGEGLAEKAGLQEPTTFPERLTRRAARNVAYAAPLALTGIGAAPAAMGALGATVVGQAAEELGVPKSYQPIAEILGGGAPQFATGVLGRTMGYIQEPLEQLASKASKAGYEMSSSAKAEQGMKYGAGASPQANINNLNKFTKEATTRAGFPTQNVNAEWIEKTGKTLGNEVKGIFAGKTFTSTPKYQTEISDIVNKAEGIFGQQGNIAKTIIEKNIGGQRAGGGLLDPSFKAEDLRGAITQVNAALSSAKGPQAGILHDLKDSLENLAKDNLQSINPSLVSKYEDWRKKYNSFATIRDLNQLEGRSGVTAAGQINPDKLLSVITNRTGGVATRNPLYQNLGKFGDVLKGQVNQPISGLQGAIRTITETPLVKGLQSVLQPRVRSSLAGYGRTAQTLAPSLLYTQQKKQPGEQ